MRRSKFGKRVCGPRTKEQIQADYQEFRGKCRPLCDALLLERPELKLERGTYVCPMWGDQAHWWLVDPDGEIVDPSARQFPSGGAGLYIPFDGTVTCAECGKKGKEEDFGHESRYSFCSAQCHARFVGIY